MHEVLPQGLWSAGTFDQDRFHKINAVLKEASPGVGRFLEPLFKGMIPDYVRALDFTPYGGLWDLLSPLEAGLPSPLVESDMTLDLRGSDHYSQRPPSYTGNWHSEGFTVATSNIPDLSTEFLLDEADEGPRAVTQYTLKSDHGLELPDIYGMSPAELAANGLQIYQCPIEGLIIGYRGLVLHRRPPSLATASGRHSRVFVRVSLLSW